MALALVLALPLNNANNNKNTFKHRPKCEPINITIQIFQNIYIHIALAALHTQHIDIDLQNADPVCVYAHHTTTIATREGHREQN